MKRHRFVTARPLREGDVCKLARAAEKENTFLSLVHSYSCIRLRDRCHWGKPTGLLLGLQSAGRQPWVNLLLEQGGWADTG